MKKTILMISLLAIQGCEPIQQRQQSLAEAADAALNPDEIHIEYHRKGNEVDYMQCRCSGTMCPEEGGSL